MDNIGANYLKNLYGFVPEKPNKKPEPPLTPKPEDFNKPWEYKDALKKHEKLLELHDKWEDPKKLLQARADRNAMRHAESDGLRVIAWLAQYLTAGEDPLKYVIQLSTQCGLDVDFEEASWSEVDDQEFDE